jgi:hypothetical protein
MIVSLLWLLVYAIALCLVVYLVFWVIKEFVGVAIPDKIEKGIWLIVLLVIVIWLVSFLLGVGPAPQGFRMGLLAWPALT